MKLYNTLTRKVEELKPLKPAEVTLYTCGPTVYNYYQIGNLRNAVFNDTLRRTLEAADYQVRHVMNITDVGHLVSDEDEGEDKLEKGAAREGQTAWEVAERYTGAFKADMAAMNVLPPSVNPERKQNEVQGDPYSRATDFIPEQIDIVQRLIEKGFAYQTKQAIYFDVTKLPDYGALTGQKLADKETGVRSDVVTDPDKKHPHDFSVWFFTVGRFAGHSMHWDSPWGDGFPGWHLECSAIIHATLGDPIDIHTGGIDHIGTHHPNEMAQTEAAFGHQLANYWVHSDFLLVDGGKMGKSLGNAYTLADITVRNFQPLALRLLYLQGHYRSEINFTWESLEAAQNRLKGYRQAADQRWQAHADSGVSTDDIEWAQERIRFALQNDLQTPLALTELSSLFGTVENDGVQSSAQQTYGNFLHFIDDTLGLKLADRADITNDQKDLITLREHSRQKKDWAASDQLRAQLAEQSVGLRDTPRGAIWYRL